MNILITGTTSGIGKYLTLKLLKKHKIYGISKSKSLINNKNYKHFKFDLENIKSLNKFFKYLKTKKVFFDIFISNAGYADNKLIFNQENKSIIKNNLINLTVPIILTKEILNGMITRKVGKIIFISSVACSLKSEATSIYTASKIGLETFSEIINKELKFFNIQSCIIRISYIKTKLSQKISKIEINKLFKKLKTKKFTKLNEIFKTINNIILGKEKKILIKDQLI